MRSDLGLDKPWMSGKCPTLRQSVASVYLVQQTKCVPLLLFLQVLGLMVQASEFSSAFGV
jgi:uncharacterized protein (UPF0212 family)